MGHTYYLVLHPIDPRATISTLSELAIRSQMMGLIGEPYFYEFARNLMYRVGHRVDDYFDNFRGSHVQLEISKYEGKPTVFCGVEVENPYCPVCQHQSYEAWHEILSAWWEIATGDTYRWQCPQCRYKHALHTLDWRRKVGIAHYGIKIEDAWDNIPTLLLLDTLAEVFGTQFTYTEVYFD